jgi:UDP-N-acetylglucosamine--N-acetylmuramyl-(pentapeptide) pyrophosphoryl-undecaprenol N-acetylglucosamine transferase
VKKNRFIISGGGTGGHIYPALSIANKINKSFNNAEIKFVGAIGRMEMNIIPKYGYNIHGLWISGLQRSFSLKNIVLPLKLIISLIQSIFILIKYKPKFVIGTGGFASFPIVFISSILRIPTLIQEQNSFPGISNRLLSNHANYISVAYDKMEKYFPSNKLFLTGNPVRESISNLNNLIDLKKKLKIDESKIVISILGGSLGSDKINRTIEENIDFIISQNIFIIWQCGKNYFEDYKKYNSDSVFVTDFIDDIDSVYYSSDLIIARSGALTLSELAIVSKPAILIPSPNVAENHQLENARAIEEKHACICIEEKDLDLIFRNKLDLVIRDKKLQEELSYNISKIALPNASNDIVELIKKHLNNDE